jgi:hypothetical protein
MKLFVKIIIVVAVLIVVGVGVVFLSIDSIAKRAIEREGTEALGVKTTVSSADIKIFAGKFALNGLNVDNPKGFDGPHFLHLKDGKVDVTMKSLRKKVVEMPLLTLDNLDLYLLKKGGQSNYNVILDNLKKFEDGKPKKPAKDSDGKRFIIHKIEINNVEAHVDLLPVAGDATKLNVPIKHIELTDIGSETKGGVLMSQLSGIVTKAVLQALIEKAGDQLPGDLLNDLRGQLGNLQSLQQMGVGVVTNVESGLTGAIQNVTGGDGKAKGAVDKVTNDIANTVNQGFSDLIGGDKNKDKNKDKDTTKDEDKEGK